MNIRTDKQKDENYIPLGINAGGIISYCMAMAVCRVLCILHDNTQNFNGVLVFANQFFYYKVLDIKLSCVFLFEYVQFSN